VVLWFGLWFALFVSVLADYFIGAEAGMLAEPLGMLTALQELVLASTFRGVLFLRDLSVLLRGIVVWIVVCCVL
jgi:hypothetical protein